MSRKKILLALDASMDSRNAAELAWDLARRLPAEITSQHVIDTVGTWRFLGNDRPGFMGSGMHISMYESLINSLRDISLRLAEVYEAHARGVNLDLQVTIDDGDPVTEVARRALDHDLVIIGHRPGEGKPSARPSFAESLAKNCPRPLLVVKGKTPHWRKMRIVIAEDHINQSYINQCLELAKSLSLEASIVGLSAGINEESEAKFAENMRNANQLAKNLTVTLHGISSTPLNQFECGWWVEQEDIESGSQETVLTVIPTYATEAERTTVYGAPAMYFVHNLRAPALLMVPEEFTGFSAPQTEKTAASGGTK